MSFEEDINNALEPLNDAVLNLGTYVWYIGLAVIVSAGLFFLFKFKGLQIRRIPEQIRLINPKNKHGKKGGKMSSFQAFCVGLGAHIGIGNITGVATAILLGGPGAVFWMWIFAIIGAATSFVECTLGQIFKRTKADGHYYGGPAYYINNGLKNHKLAVFIAVWTIVTYGVGFVSNQAANASSAVEGLVDWEFMPLITGILFAAFTAYLVFGGVSRVAKASEKIVPVMAIGWMVFALVAMVLNFRLIDDVIRIIITDAFDFGKIAAGFAGSCIMWGIKRGVFSNEAGIGSIPNVTSSSNVKHPVHQGYIQCLGVLIDTLVVCSATAFMILLAFPEGLGGLGFTANNCIAIVQDSLSSLFGGDWSKYLLAIFMFVFAFSSLIANYSMSETNTRFLTEKRGAIFGIRVMTVAAVFTGCILPISLIWNTIDILMAIMGIFNIYVLFHLYKYVVSAHDDYRRQKDKGIDEPEFFVDTLEKDGLDVSGVVSWNRD